MIAIDPGSELSAFVMYVGGRVEGADIMPNQALLDALPDFIGDDREMVAIEMVASYGMPVGREVFDTCVWIGRFMEASHGADLVYRKDVKMHLCGSMRAKDSNIRQALIDRFGPGKDKAIGKKATPGPLYGFRKDMWAALACAVTYDDQQKRAAA